MDLLRNKARKERRQRKEAARREKLLQTMEFRAVTTDHDANRNFIIDDFGTVFASSSNGEADALSRLAEKAKELGANTVVALRFAVDRDFTTAYGTARLYT